MEKTTQPQDVPDEAVDVTEEAQPEISAEAEPSEQEQSAEAAEQNTNTLTQTEETEEVEEEYTLPDFSSPELPPLDFSSLPVDENGYSDVSALGQVLQQREALLMQNATQNAIQEFEMRQQEQRLWDNAQAKFPELKTDTELRDDVQALRMGHLAATNKWLTPAQAMSRMHKRLSAQKQEGFKAATESVKIQQSAYVETASASGPAIDKKARLRRDIANPDPAIAQKAQDELLRLKLDEMWGN